MDNDNLSDDVFLDSIRHVINTDELTIGPDRIPTLTHTGLPNTEALRIYAPENEENFLLSRQREHYFYPEDQPVEEGWKSYKVEDDEPFGTILDDRFDATVNHKVRNTISK